VAKDITQPVWKAWMGSIPSCRPSNSGMTVTRRKTQVGNFLLFPKSHRRAFSPLDQDLGDSSSGVPNASCYLWIPIWHRFQSGRLDYNLCGVPNWPVVKIASVTSLVRLRNTSNNIIYNFKTSHSCPNTLATFTLVGRRNEPRLVNQRA
jgi:hypothetical protein